MSLTKKSGKDAEVLLLVWCMRGESIYTSAP